MATFDPAAEEAIRQARLSPARWQQATVTNIQRETPRVKSFTLQLERPRPFRPGQHYDVRLTAPDGILPGARVAGRNRQETDIDLKINRVTGDIVRAKANNGIVERETADESQLDGFHAARQIMLMNYAGRTLRMEEAADYIDHVMPWLERYVKRYG